MFKLKKSKSEKGITLVALIITIVVLLILAAVAINAITEYNIIENANSAAQKYGNQAGIEDETLGGYSSEIDKYLGGTSGGTGTIGTATVGNKVQSNSTINGEAYSSTNPIIPEGFIPINTATAKWDEGVLADNVKNGLVITDSVDSQGKSNGNEFVWIPVANISEMAKVTSGTDANGRKNYEGKLYDFEGTSSTEMEDYGQGTESYREPANLTSSDGDESSRFTTIMWTKNLYQESFNKMVESVSKYKGFYVGRYEMSLDANGKAQSKAGETPSKAIDSSTRGWYGLYEKTLTYSGSGVISEMIWGCQYDAMMIWMQENDIDVTSDEPYDTARGKIATKDNTTITGSVDSNDILNNVYDLIGSPYEWTQEACYTDYREYRGATNRWGEMVPGYRDDYPPLIDTSSSFGSRLTLYVE